MERSVSPCVITFLSVNSARFTLLAWENDFVIIYCTFDVINRVSYLIGDKTIQTNWFLSTHNVLYSYIQSSPSLFGLVLALCSHPDSQSLGVPYHVHTWGPAPSLQVLRQCRLYGQERGQLEGVTVSREWWVSS